MSDPRLAPAQFLHLAELFELNGDRDAAGRLLDEAALGDDAGCAAEAVRRNGELRRPRWALARP